MTPAQTVRSGSTDGYSLGVAIAAALLGERLGPTDILGVIIIAGGILAVQLARQNH